MYILDTEINDNDSIFFGLQKIYGIGKFESSNICNKLGFSFNFKINELSEKQTVQLFKLIETSKLVLNNDLKKSKILQFKKLLNIKSYRGLRKLKGLPVRGQRTHTNAKTARFVK
jgi:small subunit ribosomal protein S13